MFRDCPSNPQKLWQLIVLQLGSHLIDWAPSHSPPQILNVCQETTHLLENNQRTMLNKDRHKTSHPSLKLQSQKNKSDHPHHRELRSLDIRKLKQSNNLQLLKPNLKKLHNLRHQQFSLKMQLSHQSYPRLRLQLTK